jgi:MFS family permease
MIWASSKVSISLIAENIYCTWHTSSLLESILTAGQSSGALVGGFLFGFLSDRVGRLLPVQICSIVCLVFGIAGAFAPNYVCLLVDRFFVGFAVGGFPQIINVMVEFSKRSLRAVTLLTSQLFFALGIVLVALFGLLLMYNFGWRVFLFALYLPLLVSFIFSLLLRHPPHFLLVSGRKREAEEVLSEMLATNAAYPSLWFRNPDFQPVATEERKIESGVDSPASADEKARLVANELDSLMPLETIELEAQVFDTPVAERGNLGDIFTTNYRCTTALLLLLGFCLNFSYFGIILMTTSLIGQSSSVDNSTCLDDYAFCVSYCSLSFADYVALIVASCGDLLCVPMPVPCPAHTLYVH